MASIIVGSGKSLNQTISTVVTTVTITYGTTSAAQLVFENLSTTKQVIAFPYLARAYNVGGTGQNLSLTYYIYNKDTGSSTYFQETSITYAMGTFASANTLKRMTSATSTANQQTSTRPMDSIILMPGDKLYFVGTNNGSNSATWDITTLIQTRE